MRSHLSFSRLFLFIATWLLLAVSAHAQTTLIVTGEVSDASQFGYEQGSQGVWAELRHHFTPRVEGYIGGNLSSAKKAYIGDGRHYGGAVGVRFWVTERFFLLGGGTVSADSNSQYKKTSFRGSVGAGVRLGDWTVTGTAFAPPGGLVSDANEVKGLSLLLEYQRRIVGPVSLYGAGQVSKASFSQTGDPSQRFTGVIPRGRAGIAVTF